MSASRLEPVAMDTSSSRTPRRERVHWVRVRIARYTGATRLGGEAICTGRRQTSQVASNLARQCPLSGSHFDELFTCPQ